MAARQQGPRRFHVVARACSWVLEWGSTFESVRRRDVSAAQPERVGVGRDEVRTRDMVRRRARNDDPAQRQLVFVASEKPPESHEDRWQTKMKHNARAPQARASSLLISFPPPTHLDSHPIYPATLSNIALFFDRYPFVLSCTLPSARMVMHGATPRAMPTCFANLTKCTRAHTTPARSLNSEVLS